MKHRLAVCVPYRNREAHLKVFVPHMTRFLGSQGIDHIIIVCHQKDNKPFNRGKTLNIAFREACRLGFDYVALHDVDLLPEDASCDYSFPETAPVHLAAYQSKDDYQLLFPEYFGGCVLFSREQFEAINGFYNDYWGWGWEDDDLFYRVRRKGGACIEWLTDDLGTRKVAGLRRSDSSITIRNTNLKERTGNNSFSLMMLIKPEIDIEDYLIGEKYSYFQNRILGSSKSFVISYGKYENYIVRLDENFFNRYFVCAKAGKNKWDVLFLTVDHQQKTIRLFVNGEEASVINSCSPRYFRNSLRSIFSGDLFIGNQYPGSTHNTMNTYFKGLVGGFRIWNRPFSPDEIRKQSGDIISPLYPANLILDYDFNNPEGTLVPDISGNNNTGVMNNCSIENETVGRIFKHSLPYRRGGRYRCLPHENKGYKKQLFRSVFRQDRTASENERIFKLKVLKEQLDPDFHGLNNLEYTLLGREKIFGDHLMLNVEL